MRLPVLFRVHDGEVVAIFPTMPERSGWTCYAHCGQHGTTNSLSLGRRATESEYAPLLRELRRIYDDCELVVYKRAPRWSSRVMQEAAR